MFDIEKCDFKCVRECECNCKEDSHDCNKCSVDFSDIEYMCEQCVRVNDCPAEK